LNLSLALLAVTLSTAAPAATPTPAAAAQPPRRVLDRVAAIVNGDVVTLQELEQRAAALGLAAAEAQPAGPERDRARAEALRRAFDQVVSDKLFAEKAKELEIEVTEKQVDDAIEGVKKQNGFTDAQLESALASEGYSMTDYRARIRRELQNFSLLQYKVAGKIKTSEEDLRNYYQSHPQEFEGDDEVRVRHIFIPFAEGGGAQAEAQARAEGQRVLQRLRTGEDFGAVAKAVSRGPSAEDGGELGWLKRGTIHRTLEDAAFALETGEISGLVEAGPGIHILKVEERRRGGGKSFEQAREEIRQRLGEEQAETYRQQYVAELRRDALIDVKLPELRP
jgi:peptidyl-prolyl cis-trans isomerase SurA